MRAAATRSLAGRRRSNLNVGWRSRRRNDAGALARDRDRTARPLDGLARALRRPGDLEGEGRGELADAEDLDPVPLLRQHAGGDEGLHRDRGRSIEPARGDGLLDAAEVHLVQVARARVVEAALRQTPVKRHLAALEALDGDSGAGRLALAAPPTLLALAGAGAPADAHPVLGRARIVADLVQLHGGTLSARPRCGQGGSPWPPSRAPPGCRAGSRCGECG